MYLQEITNAGDINNVLILISEITQKYKEKSLFIQKLKPLVDWIQQVAYADFTDFVLLEQTQGIFLFSLLVLEFYFQNLLEVMHYKFKNTFHWREFLMQ